MKIWGLFHEYTQVLSERDGVSVQNFELVAIAETEGDALKILLPRSNMNISQKNDIIYIMFDDFTRDRYAIRSIELSQDVRKLKW